MRRNPCLLLLFVALPAFAGPYIPPGNLALRHDIQRLADAGVITGPVTTWPLAWGAIADDLDSADAGLLTPATVDSLVRVRERMRWAMRTDQVTLDTRIGVADNATRIRSFQETPRGRAEISGGLSYTGNWFTADVNVQFVDAAADDQDFRVDNSILGVALGNWSITAGTMQRWWGPGWDGSLILSNNARPIPSLMIDRVGTTSFRSRWLSWIGPWDLSIIFGQLEEDRVIPNTQFFGMRWSFRPVRSLEIGLSRAAQWCGDDRPCDLETFGNLLRGRDNRGGEGIEEDNEPGNQLAGFDFRWVPGWLGRRAGLYGQLIGEDEAGGFPSRYLGQFGVDWTGYLFHRWSYRAFVEFAGTACQFHEASKRYNCAYNHSIYGGYRFRSRPIGHGADNDAELLSLGLLAADADSRQWRVLLRVGDLNDGGAPDSRNSLTPTPQDIVSVDIAHGRPLRFGVIDIGVGYEEIDDVVSGTSEGEFRMYAQWRSAF